MVERIAQARKHYKEICDELGYELLVVKEQAIASEFTNDNVRYDIVTSIKGFKTRISFIDGESTVIYVSNVPLTHIHFYAHKAKPISVIFKRSRSKKVNSKRIEYGGSDDLIIKAITKGNVLNGFLSMCDNMNLKTSDMKKNQETIDSVNPDLIITIFNVPINASKLANTIKSTSTLLDSLLSQK